MRSTNRENVMNATGDKLEIVLPGWRSSFKSLRTTLKIWKHISKPLMIQVKNKRSIKRDNLARSYSIS